MHWLLITSALAGAPQVGEPFEPFSGVQVTDGQTIEVPAPGRYVVVELIRSADW